MPQIRWLQAEITVPMSIRAAALALLLAFTFMAATCDAPADAPATADAAPAESPSPTSTPDPTATPTATPPPTPSPDATSTPTVTHSPTPTPNLDATPTVSPTPAAAPTAAPTPASDRDALVALYHATDGANWKNSRDWLSQEPISRWFGVRTDAAGRVTALWLSNNQLRGALPPDLGGLTELKQLRLQGQRVAWRDSRRGGPSRQPRGAAAQWQRVQRIYSRRVWAALESESAALHVNQLSRAIPPELGNLSNLKEPGWLGIRSAGRFRRSWAAFQLGGASSQPEPAHRGHPFGARPAFQPGVAGAQRQPVERPDSPELGNLGNLWSLWLFANQLTGAIPAELGGLSKLASLHLADNQLSGAIPAELGSLADLQRWT